MALTAQKHDITTSGAQASHALLPVDFGDVRAEFHSLIVTCGVYDLSSRARISISGRDRVRWLNGMITNNIRDLASGRGVYAFLLNPQGHILGDLYAYNRDESLLIDTDQSQLEKILAVLRKYIIMDKVELANISDKLIAIGIAGPKARETLRAAGLEIPTLEPLQLVELVSNQIGLTVVRGDNEFVESFELLLGPENVDQIYPALVKAGAKPVGTAALELLRIAAGKPRYGVDIRERDLPQETEQQTALNFSKGCYIGQEIVERIRSRGNVHRKFIGFEVNGQLPAAGSKVRVDGKDVGEITSAASLPLPDGERRLALGYIRREFATPGMLMEAGGSQITIATLPFAELSR